MPDTLCHWQRGVTLLELLVVVSLSAVVLSVAVPSMSATLSSARLGTASQAMLWGMQLARSEAIKRNRRVVVCKSAGQGCVRSGGWAQGWLVFADANNNGQWDDAELALYREPGIGGDIHITGNSQVTDYISYTPLGHASMVSGAFQAGTITVCSQTTPEASRQIVLSSSGRARVVRTKLTSCL